jgi:hypothetical protein
VHTEKISRSVTHPKIALGQARLTLELFIVELLKKKIYLGGTSILSIILTLSLIAQDRLSCHLPHLTRLHVAAAIQARVRSRTQVSVGAYKTKPLTPLNPAPFLYNRAHMRPPFLSPAIVVELGPLPPRCSVMSPLELDHKEGVCHHPLVHWPHHIHEHPSLTTNFDFPHLWVNSAAAAAPDKFTTAGELLTLYFLSEKLHDMANPTHLTPSLS